MPCNSCSSPSYGPSSNEEIIKKEQLQYYKDAEAIACAFLRHMHSDRRILDDVIDKESGLNVEQVDAWWKHHETLDKNRRIQEKLEKQAKVLAIQREIKRSLEKFKELTGIDPAINFDSKS